MTDTVEYAVHFRNAGAGRRKLTKTEPKAAPRGRVPRIAKLMALAIHFERLIGEGRVRDQAEIAELGGVTRARVTQIMDLLMLAPEIQESLLAGEPRMWTRGWPNEREIRPVAKALDWTEQRRLWNAAVTARDDCKPRPR